MMETQDTSRQIDAAITPVILNQFEHDGNGPLISARNHAVTGSAIVVDDIHTLAGAS